MGWAFSWFSWHEQMVVDNGFHQGSPVFLYFDCCTICGITMA